MLAGTLLSPKPTTIYTILLKFRYVLIYSLTKHVEHVKFNFLHSSLGLQVLPIVCVHWLTPLLFQCSQECRDSCGQKPYADQNTFITCYFHGSWLWLKGHGIAQTGKQKTIRPLKLMIGSSLPTH